MKRNTRAAKIRAAIEAGESVKDIAARFKLKPQTVYTLRWKMKQESKKRVVVTRAEVDVAKKLGIPIETYAKEKLKLEQSPPPVQYPVEMESYIDDLMEIRRQINDLHVIEAFLQVRVEQMKQNAQWQTKNK